MACEGNYRFVLPPPCSPPSLLKPQDVSAVYTESADCDGVFVPRLPPCFTAHRETTLWRPYSGMGTLLALGSLGTMTKALSGWLPSLPDAGSGKAASSVLLNNFHRTCPPWSDLLTMGLVLCSLDAVIASETTRLSETQFIPTTRSFALDSSL